MTPLKHFDMCSKKKKEQLMTLWQTLEKELEKNWASSGSAQHNKASYWVYF